MLRPHNIRRTLMPLRDALELAGVPLATGYEQVHRKVFPAPIRDGRRSLVPSDGKRPAIPS